MLDLAENFQSRHLEHGLGVNSRVAASLPAKRNAGAGLLLEDATMSKLLWMLLVIGSAWADDDGRIHPKCVEENNTRRCWVERPATPSPADHGALVPVRPSTVSSIVFAATTVIATAVTSTNQPN